VCSRRSSETHSVTLNQHVNVHAQSEFDIPHPGIAEDHIKAVELSGFAIDLNSTALTPIYLGLDSWLSLIAVYGGNSDLRSYLSHKVLHDCVFACKASLLISR
jgi:hypothetical protein